MSDPLYIFRGNEREPLAVVDVAGWHNLEVRLDHYQTVVDVPIPTLAATGSGEKGDKGDPGPVGSMGPQGVKGEKGDTGADGVAGAQGPAGVNGGETGAKGPTGDKGALGDPGDKGATGDKGPRGDVGPQGPAGPASGGGTQTNFPAAIASAFDNGTYLNWTGGDVVLSTPIVLEATSDKIGFGVNMNGAKIFANYNDASKYAITFLIRQRGVNIREFSIERVTFAGQGAYAGGIKFECHMNVSWIYSFALDKITVSGHSDYAIWMDGSVFECNTTNLSSTNGRGIMRCTAYPTSEGLALPSAMQGYNWRPRDFSGDAVLMDSPTAYAEPFDLTLEKGYFVTGGGKGINAPSGLTLAKDLGFENLNGGCAIYLGYRGGKVVNCRGANPIANSNASHGMGYLVIADLANNGAFIDGCSIENENAGTGGKLAKINDLGGGHLTLDPTNSAKNGSDIETNLPNSQFLISQYVAKA